MMITGSEPFNNPGSDFLWWRDGIIYQIYPRSFADTNSDGVGDLNGITEKLDHIAALGVDAIWISPINPSPMYDFGYDASDYENIDPVFGNLMDFDRLIAEAHRRRIRVVMDLVLNHTSHLHPWFIASRSNRDDPKRDWYIWKDVGPSGRLPNNWQSTFGGRAWELDPRTGQVYYHQFLKEQPDLNWRNPQVRERIYQVLRFWLNRGVDGFRLDVVMSYFKDSHFRNNPANLFGLYAFDRQVHKYDFDQPEVISVLQDFRAVLDEYPERMAVGEVIDLDMALRYVGRNKLHLAFNFDFLRQPWNPALFHRSILRYIRHLPSDAQPCFVLGNHDVNRFPSRFGAGIDSDNRTKVAATLLLTLPGTPFIYYGEEIGMQNTPIPRAEIQDPPGRRFWPFYKGRDPVRTPMQWTAEKNSGFTTGIPWLRLNKDFHIRNVTTQNANPESVLNYYKKMINLRKITPSLRQGSYQPVTEKPTRVLAYLRQYSSENCLVILNFKNRNVNFLIPKPPMDTVWDLRLSSRRAEPVRSTGGEFKLRPLEACIFSAIQS